MSTDTIDIKVLGRYLEQEILGFIGLKKADKFSGGQSNPTYLLTADSGQYVLRTKPQGILLKSAHAVDREFRVIQALKEFDVPVPHALHLSPEPSVIGTMFYVMSFEKGRIFWDPALPDLSKNERMAIYCEMNRILATLHSLDVAQIGLSDYGKPGNYFQRQISRWSGQYLDSVDIPDANMQRLIDWLPANIPIDDGQISLIHGDFRLDNLIFDNNGFSAIALLDWELSTLGHPYADLAYQCMQLRMAHSGVLKGLGGINRTKLGIPSEAEYVRLYCHNRGIAEIPHWHFYLCFSFFRFASILHGVMKRAESGNASSKQAQDYGRLAPILAQMAVTLIEP
ncbi:MAG: aminoglycoside phosphotransferase (APT) family kinase protein [Shewanella sp.]|jgi:aminoglycoside phosphotransferase (APT) family kinase protein